MANMRNLCHLLYFSIILDVCSFPSYVPDNTEYNLSVEAALLCQNQVLNHIQLFYGKL